MKIMDVYFNVPMSYGHQGLRKICGESDLGGYVLFINKSRTALKMLTPAQVLLHLKSPSSSRPLSMDAIKHLPNCVEGNDLNYDAAVKASLNDYFANKTRKTRIYNAGDLHP